jgi:hypothetical protein
MTGADVVNRAWAMVGDVGGVKRNSAADMVVFLNDGVRDLITRRPFFTLESDGTVATGYTDLTDGNYAASTLPFSDEWLREPLAHYIAFRIFEIDAEDENNLAMSRAHFAQYLRLT